jgi:hypothetical protein
MNPYFYQLLAEDGTFAGSDFVRLSEDSLIGDFRKQVKKENSRRITVDAGELIVFRNMTAYKS